MKYDLKQCIGSRLRRLSRVTDRYFRSMLLDFDITENQMTILFVLEELGKVEQGKIGQALVLERSTVSRNIKLLEKQGLIARTVEYRPQVTLTREGSELVSKLIPIWEQTMNVLLEKIESEGLASLKNLEKRIL